MLEFKPETLKQLQDRYPKALKKIWVPVKGMADRPGLHRTNVFDGDDNIRLIISVDKHGPDDVIHFSGSFNDEGNWELNNLNLDKIVAKFYAISGEVHAAQIWYVTPGGIPHFTVVDKAHQLKHGIQGSPQLN